MSTEISSEVWKHSKQKGSRLLLLAALADYANAEGWCWPSIKSLCLRTRMGERYVQKMLAEIARDGELQIKERPGSSNYFRVTISEGVNSSSPPNSDSPRGELPFAKGVNLDAPRTISRTVKEPLRVAKHFQRPDLAEIAVYAKEIGLPETEVEAFFDRHEAGGWKVGRDTMKDWRAALRTWKRNAEKFAPASAKAAKARTPISRDVWHDRLDALCRDHGAGDRIEIEYVEKQFRKAAEYAKPLQIADYLTAQMGRIPEPWYQLILRLPGEGKIAA